jgi:MYXO-CTERM domain-containing protein
LPNVPFLFWKRACMTYRFNDQFFNRVSLLTEPASRAIFAASFQTWAAVDCGSRRPFSVEQFAGTTKTSNAEFLYDVQNESIIAARTRAEWTSLTDHDANALALTLLWHDKATGEVLDVDMELNTGAGRFNDCVTQRCTVAMIDLQNTITHEAGHLLGLGHSPEPGSTMEASTQSNPETQKRSLETDDEAGYCALSLPEPKCAGSSCACPAPPALPSHTTVKACSCRTLGATSKSSSAAFLPLALLCGLGWHRLRRRQQR